MSHQRDLAGRVMLLTGGTNGIGLATLEALARRGARLIVPARSGAAADRARRAADRTGTTLDVVSADLSQQRDVRALAAHVLDRYDTLQTLVSCAGVFMRTRELTQDGLERQLAVNHLAPFLLTALLVERLASSAPSRVVVIASQVEAVGRLRFDDLQLAQAYDPLDAYARSKLANVLFAYELAHRVAGRAITVNCLHPGVVGTTLLDHYIGRPWPFSMVNRWRNRSPRDAARAVVHLATAPELATVTGRYFHDGHETSSSPQSYDRGLARQLWDVSATLTGVAGS